MELKDAIRSLGERFLELKENIQTEEATKNAFIMPFIQVLGYDVFNPLEFVPEYVTDIGTKRGEKIDYAILQNGQPVILIECKHWSKNLNLHDNQLLRYFHVSKAKFALLTNGIEYRFYSDIESPNKMDEVPFFSFDITLINDQQMDELLKFHKKNFEVDKIINTASEMKYVNEIKAFLHSELKSPSGDFVKYIIPNVYSGRATEKVMIQFTDFAKRASTQLLNDLVSNKLKNALNQKVNTLNNTDETSTETVISSYEDKKIETTVEEMEGYFIIKALLRRKIEINRIAYRDAQSYFAILLDDNNRKTICRLYFNGSKKYIALLNEEKKEVKSEINTLDDLYNFQQKLVDAVESLDSSSAKN
jgi:hypothetical protein